MIALVAAIAAFVPGHQVSTASAQVSVHIVAGTVVHSAVTGPDRTAVLRATSLVVEGMPRPARLIEFQ